MWISDAAFSSSYCSYSLYIVLQVGKIKVIAKRGLKILRIHCQNSVIIMTNVISRLGKEWIFSTKEFLILILLSQL